MTLARWRAEREALVAAHAAVGVLVPNTADIEAVCARDRRSAADRAAVSDVHRWAGAVAGGGAAQAARVQRGVACGRRCDHGIWCSGWGDAGSTASCRGRIRVWRGAGRRSGSSPWPIRRQRMTHTPVWVRGDDGAESRRHISGYVTFGRPRALSPGRHLTGSLMSANISATSSCGARAVGTLYQAAVQVRRQELREVVHVFAQQRAAAEADPGRVRRQEVRGVDDGQVGVVLVDRHVGHDAHAHARGGHRSRSHRSRAR